MTDLHIHLDEDHPELREWARLATVSAVTAGLSGDQTLADETCSRVVVDVVGSADEVERIAYLIDALGGFVVALVCELAAMDGQEPLEMWRRVALTGAGGSGLVER